MVAAQSDRLPISSMILTFQRVIYGEEKEEEKKGRIGIMTILEW